MNWYLIKVNDIFIGIGFIHRLGISFNILRCTNFLATTFIYLRVGTDVYFEDKEVTESL